MAELIQSTIEDGIAILQLNRPEKRNALSRELIEELSTAFAAAESDSTIRSIIVTGNGPAFCAGMDLDELRGTLTATANDVWNDAHRLSELYERIYTSSKPTIAAVNGAAVAGGAGLVSVCDLAIASTTAVFGYPEVRRGLVAAMVLPHLLRHVGERSARWMLLSGELIDAVEAHRIGLVNTVVEAKELLTRARAWCRSIHQGGPKAIALTKQLLRSCSQQAVGVDELAKASAEPRLSEECHQGLKAFFDKQLPPWAATVPS